jgi:flavodoxin
MKILVINLSTTHGNTQKVADVTAGVLNAKLVKPEQVDVNSFGKYDLIGFGSGIYKFRHHKSLFDLIKRLPAQENKKAFIFSTSSRGVKSYHKALRNQLQKKGFIVVDEFACPGMDDFGPVGIFKLFKKTANKGRPNKSDLQNVRNFAEELKKHIG